MSEVKNEPTLENPSSIPPTSDTAESQSALVISRLQWIQSLVVGQVTRFTQGQSDIRVDYRDRISVATWLVVFGLGASLLMELPTIVLSAWAFGSPVAIPFTGNVTFVLFAAFTAAAGAQSVVSIHPLMLERKKGRRIWTWSYWALPMALAGITVVMLPTAPGRIAQIAELVISGIVIAVAYYGLYMTVDLDQPEGQRARLMLDLMAYASALLLFLFVYQTRTRSLLSGTLIALIATLLALEVLRTSTDRPIKALIYGGVIGLILGEATWALNYWRLPGLTGGLLLLLTFYLLIGVTQQSLQERLTGKVLAEFGAFALIALILIAWVGPGYGFN